MVYQKFTLNEVMKPKYAFASSGLFFILLGFLLFDTYLIRAGNIVLFIAVVLSIKSLEHFRSILLFFFGFLISFKMTSLGLFLEIAALFLWTTSKITSIVASPVRMLKSVFLR
ncbi:hypothetical protein NEMIN01_1586 [Nematocida minor]|uniref:uncharacterized protein n=1 Tax=Nematocida minor TaxID=1912983 RepID=UPI00221F5BA0|nr:uncharacterized protein NEMIN01_1586 [Nematocida minor]KAI5191602.1 hypothetical protein NEMIN01_1586 [Nematocida minor]